MVTFGHLVHGLDTILVSLASVIKFSSHIYHIILLHIIHIILHVNYIYNKLMLRTCLFSPWGGGGGGGGGEDCVFLKINLFTLNIFKMKWHNCIN